MNQAAAVVDDALYEEMFQIERDAIATGTGVFEDPFPIWAELLDRAPIHKGSLAECMGFPPERNGNLFKPGFSYYSVLGFAAASDVYTRKDDFSSEFFVDIGFPQQFGDSIINMDGLRHRRYRDLIQTFFQPAAAGSWWREKIIEPLVDELLGAFEKEDRIDLNSHFFARLPLHTVTAGFGMSPNQGYEFRRLINQALVHGQTREEMAASMNAAGQLLEHVIRERQAKPQDDIISKLAHADLQEDDGTVRKLTLEEVTSFCRLIVFAGGGTTWRQLGITAFALLNNRDQLEKVIRDRSLIQNAVLESVRWNPNDPLFPRKAMRDTTLHGIDIPKGSVLHICVSAANRDSSRWEDPHSYNLERPIQRSLAFAAGHHSCLGQHVARQEMSVALNGLFDRFPNIRWDPSKPPPKLSGGLLQRGAGPLHVLLH
jgi:cytochrome P450